MVCTVLRVPQPHSQAGGQGLSPGQWPSSSHRQLFTAGSSSLLKQLVILSILPASVSAFDPHPHPPPPGTERSA